MGSTIAIVALLLIMLSLVMYILMLHLRLIDMETHKIGAEIISYFHEGEAAAATDELKKQLGYIEHYKARHAEDTILLESALSAAHYFVKERAEARKAAADAEYAFDAMVEMLISGGDLCIATMKPAYNGKIHVR